MRAAILLLALYACLAASCGQASRDKSDSPATETKGTAKATVKTRASETASAADTKFELGCKYPVDGNKDTAATVLARFGKDARRATIPGPEGSEFKGLVLWDKDPARRLELIIDDESKDERIFGLNVRGAGSRWTVAGLSIGSPLAKVVETNGEDLTFWGFEWDYGGYVSDFRNGKLDGKTFGCEVNLRLNLDAQGEEDTEGLIGDTPVNSGHPKLVGAKVTVDELGLNWR